MKLNRSFSRRIGKSLSPLQEELLEQKLPEFLLSTMLEDGSLINSKFDKYICEIGIGMGDHFISKASSNPMNLHIGFEPYLNGIANSLKLSSSLGIENIILWPDDMDLIFDKLPDDFLSEIYILFPDPWPKSRHHKRRIIHLERLKLFAKKLKSNGRLYFASDIKDYFDSAREIISSSLLFQEDYAGIKPMNGYIKTRYHLKAEEENRIPQFLFTTVLKDSIL